MANKVKQRRNARGMKQNELAAKVGLSQPALSDIEAGKHAPSVYVAMRLSKVLRCRVEDLFIEPDGWTEKEFDHSGKERGSAGYGGMSR